LQRQDISGQSARRMEWFLPERSLQESSPQELKKEGRKVGVQLGAKPTSVLEGANLGLMVVRARLTRKIKRNGGDRIERKADYSLLWVGGGGLGVVGGGCGGGGGGGGVGGAIARRHLRLNHLKATLTGRGEPKRKTEQRWR